MKDIAVTNDGVSVLLVVEVLHEMLILWLFVCVQACTYKNVCPCRGQGCYQVIFPYCSPPYLLKQGLSMNLKLAI